MAELYSLIRSSSDFAKGSSPMRGVTSAYFAKASSVGDFMRGSSLLKRRKEVVGCFRARERKAWSGRRKDTRFSGEPVCHTSTSLGV